MNPDNNLWSKIFETVKRMYPFKLATNAAPFQSITGFPAKKFEILLFSKVEQNAFEDFPA
jgi:hypothetical protein